MTQSGYRVLLKILLVVGLLVPMSTALRPTPVEAQGGPRCFPQTGLCISGRLREFWEQHGGLPVFGLPITPPIPQRIEGREIRVQWFERNRLELHSDNERPYDVLPGRIGSEALEQQEATDASAGPLAPVADEESCRLFPETNHRVCGEFLAMWQANGLELDGHPGLSKTENLALFGLPLTEARIETLSDGKQYTVQWFERARLELHPEYAPPNHVQAGLLGNELRGTTPSAWPRFEPAECPINTGGIPVQCGYLHVPEDRTLPDSRTIQLAVAVFPSHSASRRPDPVVYLSGGPGSPALANALTFARGWSGFLANRDFVVVDQRGTGFSRPALMCPELSQLARDMLGQKISRADKVKAEVDTALQCRNRLVNEEGVNIGGYRSTESAADLNDVRLALGYPQLNLFGISYGTRLALTTMRDYPDAVRSVVLDSVYPLQVNLFTEMPANMDRAFNQLFAGCAHDPACNQAYPNLKQVFAELVAQLDANPVQVSPRSPATGKAIEIRVDGTELINLTFRLLYDSNAIPSLPQMIYETYNGEYAMLTQMQQRRLGRSGGGFSHGVYFSVECSDEILLATVDEVVQTQQAFPLLQPFFEGIPENTPEIFRLCNEWGVHAPQPSENEPVHSDIPTLILAGTYDPITPPAWAWKAAETLSKSYVYEFPFTGHAVIGRGACPQHIIRAFLEHPDAPPDGSCVSW
jgi:pimeloyl-ACP methyl ester carboxylesterase